MTALILTRSRRVSAAIAGCSNQSRISALMAELRANGEKRAEIYTYESETRVYAMNWSVSLGLDARFRPTMCIRILTGDVFTLRSVEIRSLDWQWHLLKNNATTTWRSSNVSSVGMMFESWGVSSLCLCIM